MTPAHQQAAGIAGAADDDEGLVDVGDLAHEAPLGEGVLEAGRDKARGFATPYLAELRRAVGIRPLA